MSSPRDDTADETADDTAFYKENVPVFSITQNVNNNSCNAIIKPSFRDELEQKTQIHCVNENVSVATTDMLMNNHRMVESFAKRNVAHNRVQSSIVPLISRIETLEAQNTTKEGEINALKAENVTKEAEIATMKGQIAALEAENVTKEARIAALEARFAALEAKNSSCCVIS